MFGGESPRGFDCSGYTEYVFEKMGKDLPRLAHWQSNTGAWKNKMNAETGDLIFFGRRKFLNWYASHVGIVVSNHHGVIRFIHASRSKGIEIKSLDKSRYWQAKYLFIKSPFASVVG